MVILLSLSIAVSPLPSGAAEEAPPPGLYDKGGPFGFRSLEPDRFLITGGTEQPTDNGVSVVPEVGLSHTVRERESGIASDNILHKVHAQAGGKIGFQDHFYLGFATKLPIYNYEATEKRSPGGSSPETSGRHDYEILKLSPENLTWTGEAGYNINQSLKLNIFYDRNRFDSPMATGNARDEEVFGTRFEIQFK
jgi:hypothetical protein